jgi:tRNA dimethylallyltransferase
LIPYDVEGVPLWMYDVVNPDEEFSVAQYQFLVRSVIETILKRGKVPVVVGGTGLYIRSIIRPFETADIKPDADLREAVKNISLHVLQDMVKSENGEVWDAMNISDRSNPRRLIRKLEIIRSAHSPKPSDFKKIDSVIIGLTAPNSVLFERIDARVETRMDDGLLHEIENLRKQGYDWRFPSFDALGYRQWRPWFETNVHQTDEDKHNIINKWKQEEHAYARRQMTWFKKEKGIRWFDISKTEAIEDAKETAVAWYNTHT